MEREIKFRAWAVASKEMFVPDTESGWEIFDGKLDVLPNTILMQYTGFRHKDGAELYEDDVVYLAGYGNYLVEYPFIELYEAQAEGDIGDILGNIHENPELKETI